MDAVVPEKQGQLYRLLEGAAGGGGHEIGDEILLFADALGDLVEPFLKRLIALDVGLSHFVQHHVADVFRCDLQLTAYVFRHQFLEKGVVLVRHHIVEPDAGADKDTLDPGQLSQLAENAQVFAVVHLQCLAGFGSKALFPRTHPGFCLLFAGRQPEVCGRTAHVVDIALEVGHFGDLFCLFQDGFLAAAGDAPSLVQGDGAEVAVAETAPVVGD